MSVDFCIRYSLATIVYCHFALDYRNIGLMPFLVGLMDMMDEGFRESPLDGLMKKSLLLYLRL